MTQEKTENRLADQNFIDEGMRDPCESGDTISKFDLLGVIGFSFYLAWMFLIFITSLFVPAEYDGFDSVSLVICYLSAEVVASLIMWRLSRHLVFNTSVKAIIVWAALLTPIPGLCTLFMDPSLLFLRIIWCIAGVGAVCLTGLWGVFLVGLNHAAARLYPAVSLLISSFIIFAVLCFIKAEAVKGIIVLLPWLSVVLFLIMEFKPVRGKKQSFFEPSRNVYMPHDIKLFIHSQSAIFTHSVFLGIAFFVASAAVDNYIGMLVFAAMLVASACKAVDATGPQRYEVSTSLKILAPTAVICLLFLPYIDAPWRIACIVAMTFFATFGEILNWVAISECTKLENILPFANMAYGRISNIIGLGVGYVCAFLTFGTSFPEGDVLRPYILGLIVIVVVMLQVFLFKDNYSILALHGNMEEKFDDLEDYAVYRSGKWREKCERFADAYTLTTRQREVLYLLAKGYSTNYIKEVLVVSEYTVKAHIYNIYKKTDVHTRQELIEMIENYHLQNEHSGE
jgi:DNA-binding CsgD family transcriptional regulator